MKQIEDLLDKIKLYSNLMSESLNADIHGALEIDEMVDNFTDRFHPQISGFQIVKRYGGGSLSSKDCYEVTEQEEL